MTVGRRRAGLDKAAPAGKNSGLSRSGVVSSFARKVYESLIVAERLPEAEADARADHALAGIVDHALRTVPFYAERLKGIVAPRGIDAEAWASVPPLTRADLGANEDALTSTADMVAHGEVRSFSSSGSTGVPVTVKTTERRRLVNLAVNAQMFTWFGVDARLPLVMVKGHHHPKLEFGTIVADKWVPDWLVGEDHGGFMRLHYPITAAEQIDRLRDVGPCYLNTQPSNLRLLCRAVAGGAPRPDLRGIITVGELVTADDRRKVVDLLGSRILDHYSSQETGVTASECEHGRMHVHAELNRVETVRPDGQPCAPGEDGRILITTLLNAAMPLIRYDIGDVGALDRGCPCGRTLPVLKMTVGRQRTAFHFPDGASFVPLFYVDEQADIFPVTEWQLRQVGATYLELRYSSPEPEARLDREALRDRIVRYFGRPLQVDFVRYDVVPRTGTGKLEPYLNLH